MNYDPYNHFGGVKVPAEVGGNFEISQNPKMFTEKCQNNIDLGPKKTIFCILLGSGTPLKRWDLKFPIQFAKN